MSYNKNDTFTIMLPLSRESEQENITRRFHEEYADCSVAIELSSDAQLPELKSAESSRELTEELGQAFAMSAGSFLHLITWREE
jgi:hypothetical protein